MRCAVLHAPGDLRLEERPTPTPGPGEVLLTVEANTLCGTDGRILRGEKTSGVRPGVVLGHEVAARVAELGQGVEGLEVGRQATVSIVVSCNACHACLADMEHMCLNLSLIGYEIDGGLSDYLLVPRDAVRNNNIIQTAKEMPATTLALAEPISCCLNGLSNYRVEPGDTVVVMGAGPIGLIHTSLASLSGADQIIVSNRSAGRRDLAMQSGATHAVDPTRQSLSDVVMTATHNRGADAVVVCIGVPEMAQQALELARIGGRVNYFAGFPKGSTSTLEPNLIHYKELSVTGGSNARRRDVVRAVQLLETGRLDVGALVTHTFGLEDAHQAFEAVESRQGVKIAVTP